MTQRRMRDDAPPWSFFLPVLLAVALGVLLADVVKLAASAVFARSDPAQAAAPAAEVDAAGADDAADPAEDADALVEIGEVQAGDLVLLPGPVAAMRDGAARACINGTVALRQPNGWVQGLEDDAPLRCRAGSP